MLLTLCVRKATLSILVICTIVLWHLVLRHVPKESYALTTASAESLPRQIRGVDTTSDGSTLVAESAVHLRTLDVRDGGNEAVVAPDPSSLPDPGDVGSKIINLIAKVEYNFVANIPPVTARALMVHTLLSIDDFEIISMVRKSKTFTVELYPDRALGHSVTDGHCLIEFSVPFMGDHPGLALMICMAPIVRKFPHIITGFFGKVVGKNKSSQKDITKSYDFFLNVKLPLKNNPSPSTIDCNLFNRYKVFYELFSNAESYVYEELGTSRFLYMDTATILEKNQVRMKFLNRLYDYATPEKCRDKIPDKDIELYSNLYKDHLIDIAKGEEIKKCPSGLRTAVNNEFLLNKDELAALRSFDIYNRTDLRNLLEHDSSNIRPTRCECMFYELAREYDLSAEYKISDAHYVRIEYFKDENTKGAVPGQLLYVSINIYGSIDVVLFKPIHPQPGNPYEYNDYQRIVKLKVQPFPSDAVHIIDAKSIADTKYSPDEQDFLERNKSGYGMFCAHKREKEVKGTRKKFGKYVDNVYKIIYEYSGLDFHLRKDKGNGDFLKHIENPDLQKKIVSDYLKVEKLRKKFLRKALSRVDCDKPPKDERWKYMAPVPINHKWYENNPSTHEIKQHIRLLLKG